MQLCRQSPVDFASVIECSTPRVGRCRRKAYKLNAASFTRIYSEGRATDNGKEPVVRGRPTGWPESRQGCPES